MIPVLTDYNEFSLLEWEKAQLIIKNSHGC